MAKALDINNEPEEPIDEAEDVDVQPPSDQPLAHMNDNPEDVKEDKDQK